MAKKKQNLYQHKIDLVNLKIKNRPNEKFRKLLEDIQYRGYEVEELSDGRKIVITKPGGKYVFGKVRREDFIVWVYNPADSSLWAISHKNIEDDIHEKRGVDPKVALKILDALEKVYYGEEPDDVLKSNDFTNPCGESPEVLLKSYKWIWGQEDCNYPEGKGRAMSWGGWKKDGNKWIKTGKGLIDLRNQLRDELEKVGK